MLQVSIQNYPWPTPEFTTIFWWGTCCSFLFFLCCPVVCLCDLGSVLWCLLRFPFGTGLSLPPVVCRRAHVLFTLFVFVCVRWCPTHIVLRFCLFCTLCCQFLWIVHFWLYSVFSNIYWHTTYLLYISISLCTEQFMKLSKWWLQVNQELILVKLKSSLRKFFGRHIDL